MNCNVERVKLVKSGTLSLATGAINHTREETHTEPCDTPLFSDAERKHGICRACLEGWAHPENKPTTRGLQQIQRAKQIEFIAKLRAVRGHSDMKQLVVEMDKTGAGFFLHSKRSGRHAYAFSEYPPNPAKCHYLLDDGVSTGLCRWENLYKVLEVRA